MAKNSAELSLNADHRLETRDQRCQCGSVGRFDDNMTGGRGYIGLAAMIVGCAAPGKFSP